MDLYTDFLTASPNVASAVVLSKLINVSYSHDSITRMLAQEEISQKEYWRSIKKLVRCIETQEGVISIDDFIPTFGLKHNKHSLGLVTHALDMGIFFR